MKQIIAIRKDLGMRAGKMVAQGAHASLAVVLAHQDDPRIKEWLDGSFTKVAVRVESLAELDALYLKAIREGLLASYIVDNGLTEFDGVKTPTAVAIGPDTEDKLHPVTGHLRLL